VRTETHETRQVTTSDDLQTRHWHAYLNTQPPKPDNFYVVGEAYVPNPGVTPRLHKIEPQGFNPAILMLELFLVQEPGIWPQGFVWNPARYDDPAASPEYGSVEIRHNGVVIATIPVEIVS
jgi:hypothetical protein